MEASVKLNLGCGKTVPPGWVNMDKSPSVFLSAFPALRSALLRAGVLTAQQAEGFPRGVVHANVARHIPVADGSVDFIYSSHMIEHLSRWEGLRFVRECRRALRRGGTLRLATPDLKMMVEDYLSGTSPFLREDCTTPADAFCREYNAYAHLEGNAVKAAVRKHLGGDIHQWLYDRQSIGELLLEGGFSDITHCSFLQGLTPDLAAVEHRERGLFVEARSH